MSSSIFSRTTQDHAQTDHLSILFPILDVFYPVKIILDFFSVTWIWLSALWELPWLTVNLLSEHNKAKNRSMGISNDSFGTCDPERTRTFNQTTKRQQGQCPLSLWGFIVTTPLVLYPNDDRGVWRVNLRTTGRNRSLRYWLRRDEACAYRG